MRGRSRAMAAAALTTVALVATACGGGGTSEPAATGGAAGGGSISVRGCTAQTKGYIPGNTAETCGGNVVNAYTSGLVHYNTDTAEAQLDIAESIDTDNNQDFTIKLKSGRTFQDGTPVTASSFVDAWNYTAYAPNGQQGAYFFSPFAGYGDLQCEETDEEGACKEGTKPKSEKMSGLKAVDDTTLTIRTTEKVSNLPIRLGYSAFMPLPESFFGDPKAFETKPIGAGPFSIESISDTETVMKKFADYKGEFPANVDQITYRIYNDDNAAYNEVVSNNLDITDIIPADQLVGDAYKTDLDGRNASRESGIIQYVGFSPLDEQFKDNVKLRQAFSMAVDRAAITDKVFNKTRVPADGWVSPVVDGYKAGACGDACTYNADEAKKLYDEAGGYKGALTLAVNGDGGHKPWAEAACNNWKTVLGVDCRVVVTPDFKTLLDQLEKAEIKGMFRYGWQMDYPSIENFLSPVFSSAALPPAGSNYARYKNADFDKTLNDAAAADSIEQANTLYQQAEAKLAEELPVFPTWYSSTQIGWSSKVTGVKLDPFGRIDLAAVKIA